MMSEQKQLAALNKFVWRFVSLASVALGARNSQIVCFIASAFANRVHVFNRCGFIGCSFPAVNTPSPPLFDFCHQHYRIISGLCLRPLGVYSRKGLNAIVVSVLCFFVVAAVVGFMLFRVGLSIEFSSEKNLLALAIVQCATYCIICVPIGFSPFLGCNLDFIWVIKSVSLLSFTMQRELCRCAWHSKNLAAHTLTMTGKPEIGRTSAAPGGREIEWNSLQSLSIRGLVSTALLIALASGILRA